MAMDKNTSHFGDIMSPIHGQDGDPEKRPTSGINAHPTLPDPPKLLTTDPIFFTKTTRPISPLDFTPLQRILLTANGNVQRILSSYYHKSIRVEVLKWENVNVNDNVISNSMKNDDNCDDNGMTFQPRRYKRHVKLYLNMGTSTSTSSHNSETREPKVTTTTNEKEVCDATSEISITDPTIYALLESETVGIGQLFRYLNVLPEFELLDAGIGEAPSNSKIEENAHLSDNKNSYNHSWKWEDVFWREYILSTSGVSCRIFEVYPRNVFHLE